MNHQYIDKGRCIFCGKDTHEASFKNKPHTMPKSLGGKTIGVDICDSCNNFFGTPDHSMTPHLSPEVCVKEIFGMIRYMLQYEQHKYDKAHLPSIYFNIRLSENKIEIKKRFKIGGAFNRVFTTQFKRGLYEMFLQEYHNATRNGLEERFDKVRFYARYNIGNLPLWHITGDNGIILVENNLDEPRMPFTEHQLNQIDTFGFYSFILFGHWFYLEVTPKAELCRDIYLQNQIKEIGGSGFIFNRIIEITDISSIDFFLTKLYHQ